jgi:hypothetical protein
VTVLDESPRMVLVEASRDTVKQLVDELAGWVFAEERTLPLPDPRPKVLS